MQQASRSEVGQLMEGHDAVNRRWLDYELDVGKLIDFPVMTDVREPLTVAFLRAKRTADALRPRKLLRIAAERQAAYKRARRQLDGLIVLPEAALAALEEGIAGMIDAGRARDLQQG